MAPFQVPVIELALARAENGCALEPIAHKRTDAHASLSSYSEHVHSTIEHGFLVDKL